MKHLFKCLFILCLIFLLGGCLNTARTPYNEVGLFSGKSLDEKGEELATPPKDAISMWPFYLSDGRASYYLWPFIKNSPGCFAFLPFYNYDNGIHDIALLCTLSPKTSEYRLFPIYWQNKNGWTLLPFAYSYGDGNDYLRGCPLIFNMYEDERDWGCFSLPFFVYGRDKKDDDYTFWSLPYLSYRDTSQYKYEREGKDVYNSYRSTYRGSGLWLYGHLSEEWWNAPLADGPATATKYENYEHRWLFPLWWYGKDTNNDRWHHIVPLWWSWYDADKEQNNNLLFPIFFSRTYADGDSIFTSPLVGWGDNKAKDVAWWYALIAGASREGEYNRTSWCLPFYFKNESRQKDTHTSSIWTLFGGMTETKLLPRNERENALSFETPSSSWHAGLLLPIFGTGSESPGASKMSLLMGLAFQSKEKYLTDQSRTGEIERLALAEREHSSLWGLLYEKSHYEAPLRAMTARPIDRDYVSKYAYLGTREGDSFNLLAGLYGKSDVVEYAKDDLLACRDIGIRTETLNLGWILWRQSQITTVGQRVEAPGFVNNITEGESFSLLAGLWSSSLKTELLRSEVYEPRNLPTETPTAMNVDREWMLAWSLLGRAWESEQWAWSSKKGCFEQLYHRRGIGQLLFRHSYDLDEKGERIPNKYETGVLFDFFTCTRTPSRLDIELGWGLLADIAVPYEAKDYIVKQSILLGLPYDRHVSMWTSNQYDKTKGDSIETNTSYYATTSSMWSLLYRRTYDEDKDLTYYHNVISHEDDECLVCKVETNEPCYHMRSRRERTRIEDRLVLGILYYREFEDNRVWSRETVDTEQEMLSYDHYSDDRYVLFGIPYQWHGQRDGSYKHTALWGLLFDQTVNVADETETFGILGFLYRSNKYKDGAKTRFIFPFITTSSNEDENTWSFGFAHKLFRIEKNADGTLDWWLFWL